MTYDRTITITVGASRKAVYWQAQTLTLSQMWEKLRVPARSTETMDAYFKMTKAQQDTLKDIGGFVAGVLEGTRRKADAVRGRDLLTLDLDNIPAGGTDDVLRRIEALGCGYCVYSTRKHLPSAPRLRVLLPLDRTASADEYEPCARRMADYIGISLADPTTFEASRLMYFPSCCADGEFVYRTADKPMLSVDGLLSTYRNWRDVSAWPQVPGAVSPVRLATRQGDPLTKSGIVGAFCRTYSIEEAMAAFIPAAYESVDNAEGRYTYTGGSTTGGAVLYDDGKFLYSHHATDPCGGKLVNAFDMVRLHRFEGLDDEAQPDTPANRLPSYTAMCELARQDKAVMTLLAKERYAEATEGFTAAEAADDGAWRLPPMMDINGQGRPEKSLKNLCNALRNDPKLKGLLRLNLFSGRIDLTGAAPWSRPESAATWCDDDTAQVRVYLEPLFGKVPKNDVVDAVAAVAREQAYHPIKDYLNGLQWDGAARLDGVFIDYLGAEDSAYTRAVTRKSLVAAVARVMHPGCKYDTMPVLVGAQGRHKSTILAKLGGAWFSDSLRTFEGKDAMETIQGTWLDEIPEMQAMGRSDINAVKAFLTKTNDYYRAAYGRYTADRPRQCVFFGTTNSRECLTDTTGGRRFWPIDIDQQPRTKNVFADLPRERDQIWAEAVACWKGGETLYLDTETEQAARMQQESHRQVHPWEGIIRDFLEKEVPEDWLRWELPQRLMYWGGNAKGDTKTVPRTRICAVEIWCEALGKPKSDLSKTISREINQILERQEDWKPVGLKKAGAPYGPQRCFER